MNACTYVYVGMYMFICLCMYVHDYHNYSSEESFLFDQKEIEGSVNYFDGDLPNLPMFSPTNILHYICVHILQNVGE